MFTLRSPFARAGSRSGNTTVPWQVEVMRWRFDMQVKASGRRGPRRACRAQRVAGLASEVAWLAALSQCTRSTVTCELAPGVIGRASPPRHTLSTTCCTPPSSSTLHTRHSTRSRRLPPAFTSPPANAPRLFLPSGSNHSTLAAIHRTAHSHLTQCPKSRHGRRPPAAGAPSEVAEEASAGVDRAVAGSPSTAQCQMPSLRKTHSKTRASSAR